MSSRCSCTRSKPRAKMARASSDADILRWLKFASAEGIQIVICGGSEAWKVTEQLRASGSAVLLELDGLLWWR